MLFIEEQEKLIAERGESAQINYIPNRRFAFSSEENEGQLDLNFGSSYKTSDFIVDSLYWWWKQIPASRTTTTRFDSNQTG